jgi:hypothetical protein
VAGYVLGFVFFGLALLLWLRGFGRLIVPILLLGVIGYGAWWFVQKVREPVE